MSDLIFVKLQPYGQNYVMVRRIHKLSKRFYGPYNIVKVVGEFAFKLDFPLTSKIHPIFHGSQLKTCLDPTTQSFIALINAVDNQPLIQPLVVLDWEQAENNDNLQLLIQWEGLSPKDATQKPFSDIKNTYPHSLLKDKVYFEGEEDVMDNNDWLESEEEEKPIP